MFFAAPSPSHLKLDKMSFSQKVQLALVLGLNNELKGALAAAASLRHKFAHKLEMQMSKKEVADLINTFAAPARQRFQKLLHDTIPNGRRLSEDAESCFKVRHQLLTFFTRLFDEVAEERHRVAFEKLQQMAWH